MYAVPLKLLAKLKGSTFPKLIHTAHGMDHIHKRPITLVYEKLCASITDVTVGVSPAVMNVYRQRLFVHHERAININNGTLIENMPFSKGEYRKKINAQFGITNGNPIWVYVARVVPLKNHHFIIEAMKDSPQRNIIFVGPSGDDHYWEKIQNLLPPHIHMVGSCSNVNEILAASDFYISASTHEGIPVAVLEAGAMKLPCLLSDIPGHRMMGEAAEYFSLENIHELKTKMAWLEKNSEIKNTLSYNLHQKVINHYSSKTMSDAYLAAYSGKAI